VGLGNRSLLERIRPLPVARLFRIDTSPDIVPYRP
jgi:hypothetical protein